MICRCMNGGWLSMGIRFGRWQEEGKGYQCRHWLELAQACAMAI